MHFKQNTRCPAIAQAMCIDIAKRMDFALVFTNTAEKKKLFSNNYQHWHTTKFNIRPFNIQLAPSFFAFFCNIANFFPHLDYDSIVKKAQHFR